MVKTSEPDFFRTLQTAAAKGSIPFSRWRAIFSITTMASSTTNPVAMVIAISDTVVNAVSEQVHHTECADQRDWHSHGGN